MNRTPKIVIASDSFKGSLASSEVAEAVSEGIRAVCPMAETVKVNVADGGEGTTEAIIQSTDGERVTVYVHDPLGRRIETFYGLIDNGCTAIIEAAAASGLTLLSDEERNPMRTSTFGTGEMIADAVKKGCRRFMIGLGGSATNDGGLGMLSAFGYKFYGSSGNLLGGCGESLGQVSHIDSSEIIPEIAECEFVIACDVDNPLYGLSGAAYIFAPQKGADRIMVEKLDEGLRNFSSRIKELRNKDISHIPGAGAAGGLGGAFLAFTNCRLVRGIEMVLDAIDFDGLISGADLIITGEGKIDKQTAMGKVPSGVLERASRLNISTIALGGIVEDSDAVKTLGFDKIVQITPADMDISTAMQPEVAKSNIRNAVSDYFADNFQFQNIRP